MTDNSGKKIGTFNATTTPSNPTTESLISKNASMINEILSSVRLAKSKESFLISTPDAKRLWKPMSNHQTNTSIQHFASQTKPQQQQINQSLHPTTTPSNFQANTSSTQQQHQQSQRIVSSSFDMKQPHGLSSTFRSPIQTISNLPIINTHSSHLMTEKPQRSIGSLCQLHDTDEDSVTDDVLMQHQQKHSLPNNNLLSPTTLSTTSNLHASAFLASNNNNNNNKQKTSQINQFNSSNNTLPQTEQLFSPNPIERSQQNLNVRSPLASPDQKQSFSRARITDFNSSSNLSSHSDPKRSFLHSKSQRNSLSSIGAQTIQSGTNQCSTRDISHIQEFSSTYRRTPASQLKSEQQFQLLLTPSVQQKRPNLFHSRKESYPSSLQSYSGNSENKLYQSPEAKGTVSSHQQSNDQQTPITQTQVTSTSYGFSHFFPTSFLEEFLDIVKETNSNLLSYQPNSSTMLDQHNNTNSTKSSIIVNSSTNMNANVNSPAEIVTNSASILKSIHSEIQTILLSQSAKPSQTTMATSSLAELAYSLKRSHPNLFTGQPSGRAEVQVVQNWLENTLDNVIWAKEKKIEERFQRVDDALILTFNELVRQVSYQCRERGMLLLSVFSCYFGLVKKMSVFEQEEKTRMQLENEYQKLLLQQTADANVDSKVSEIRALEKLLKIERQHIESLKGELLTSEAREKAHFLKNEKLKQINDKAKLQILKMKKEIEDLHSRLSSKEFFEKKKLEKALGEYKSTLQKQLTSNSLATSKAFETFELADEKLLAHLAVSDKNSNEQQTQLDDPEELLQLSFEQIIKDAAEHTSLPQNDVMIRQVADEKVEAMICQEVQTDPFMTLTYNKSIKVQTDLDFIDKKFDRVFSSKQKVEEYIREQQIKADLLQLEEFAGETALNTSLDQDVSHDEMNSARGEKPILSNLFMGLPIKQLKKKIPKNNLEKFIENMGVLYSYLHTPAEKDGTNPNNNNNNNPNSTSGQSLMPDHSLKNLIVNNLRKEESQSSQQINGINQQQSMPQIVSTVTFASPSQLHLNEQSKSMKEIQEVDEHQEGNDQLISPRVSSKVEFNLDDQGRTEFKRTPKKASSMIGVARAKTIALAALASKMGDEKSQIKELLRGITLDHRVLASLETVSSEPPQIQDVLEIVHKQKILIDKFNALVFPTTNSEGTTAESTSSDKISSDFKIPKAVATALPNTSISSIATNMNMVQNLTKRQLGKRSSVPLISNQLPQAFMKKPIIPLTQTSPQKHASSTSKEIPFHSSKSGSQIEIPLHHGITTNMIPAGSNHQISNHHNSHSINNASHHHQNNASKHTEESDANNTSLVQDQQYESQSQSDPEFKQQIIGLVQLYNMEIEKNSNLRESLEELIKLLRELYHFSKSLFIHIKKTQKHTHKSIIEGFIQTFTSLKWKLPKEFDKNFETEILKEDKEDAGKKLQRLKFSNKRSTQRFLAHVQKSQAFNKLSIVDKSQHFGFIVANRIREQGIPKKYSSFLPLKNTLKYIQNLVDERVRMVREKRLSPDQDMPIFAFNKFLQIFGFRRVAENKYTQFLMSVMHYQSIYRVNMFARLMTIINDKKLNFTNDEMEKYFNAYEFILNLSTMGVVNPQHSETDATLTVALLKALDYVKVILEKIMPAEDTQDLRMVLDQMKEVDLKSANKILMVDFDLFLNKVLSKYRLLINRTQIFVKNAFFAADLDGNERINLNEFLTLYRHIMPTKFNLMKCIKMFEEKADIITEDQKNLSFEKFTAICIDHNLFTTQMQDKYIQITHKEEIPKVLATLKLSWQEEYAKLNAKIELLKPFVVPQNYKNWVEVGTVLDQRLNSEDISEENQRPILIAHRLLNDELDRLIEEGKKGSDEADDAEDDDEDDDNYDDEIFNFQDEDDNDIQAILKNMNTHKATAAQQQQQQQQQQQLQLQQQHNSALDTSQRHLDDSELKSHRNLNNHK